MVGLYRYHFRPDREFPWSFVCLAPTIDKFNQYLSFELDHYMYSGMYNRLVKELP